MEDELEHTSKPLTESQFYKWRCLVALAHADGRVTPEEKNVLEYQFRQVDFSQEQMTTLSNDIDDAQDIKVLYEKVDDPYDRKHLVQLAFTLFWADYDFDQAEQKVFQYLKEGLIRG